MHAPKPQIICKILDAGLLPVFYHNDVEVATAIVKACIHGGTHILEFTNRGDQAYQVFSELVKTFQAQAILGVGTIFDASTAALYINSGAQFIVGPILNPEVAAICHCRHVPYFPGCQTPTEISRAERLGADIVKVFPATILTPKFIKAVLATSPTSLLMPSGGVNATTKDVFAWIQAGAQVLNMGSALFPGPVVSKGEYDKITQKVQHCLQWIREARKGTAEALL